VNDWPGVEDRAAREALLRDVANAVIYWTEHGVQQTCGTEVLPEWLDPQLTSALKALRSLPGLGEHADAMAAMLSGCLSGLAHSMLVTLDGGSANCPTLDLHTPDGKSLGDALHEEWPDFDPIS
jgi:hypothetical protein